MKKILFLFIAAAFFYACPDILPDDKVNEGCNHSYYIFDNDVSFLPADSIIHIGDTITVSSFIPREKWDRDSNYIFILDSVDFHMGGGIIKLDTVIRRGKHYNFMDDFDWIVDSIYNFSIGSISYSFNYNYSNDGYYIQFYMIPKLKGIYNFDFNSLIGATPNIKGKVIETKNGNCKTDAWYPYFQTNNGNNFRELLKRSPNEDYNTKYYNKWSRYNTIYGAHCFKVVE